jgi:hypothetical protein
VEISTLLNLVKLRYGDAPVFLNVASVINQSAVEGSIGYREDELKIPPLPCPFNALHSWSGTGRDTDKHFPLRTCASGKKNVPSKLSSTLVTARGEGQTPWKISLVGYQTNSSVE